MDTNHIIEATYGLRLGELSSSTDKKTFFDIKNTILSSIHVRRTVLSIGGKNCNKHTMQYIHTLGPIMYIALPLSILLQYQSKTKAIQSSSDNKKNFKEHVYEKDLLYTQKATYKITYKGQPLEHIIHMIIQNLKDNSTIK